MTYSHKFADKEKQFLICKIVNMRMLKLLVNLQIWISEAALTIIIIILFLAT